MNFWQQGVETIPGISQKGKILFERLAINRLDDLIWHFPISYQDRRVKKIASLKNGSFNQQPSLIQGEVVNRQFIQSRNKYWRFRILDCSGEIDVLFFNLPFYLAKKLQLGIKIECFGSVFFAGKSVAMMHPKFKILSIGANFENNPVSHYQAVYPTVKSLAQAKVQKAVEFCFNQLKNHPITNALDIEFNHLPSLSDALLFLHQVPIEIDLDQLHQQKAIKRLVVDELSQLILSSEIAKINRKKITTQAYPPNRDLISFDQKLNQSLEFELNADQKQCVQEVRADLAKNRPMQRLIQGDVGSGKTIVSAFCALSVLNHRSQVALLAPTEVLANQHYQNFKKWFQPLGIEVLYLSRSIKAKQREAVEQTLKSNQSLLLIGTHIIFQKTIGFGNLALVMIDEPQRFGVMQRLQLLQKAKHTHQLLISATPIPRTLAQSIYADLSVSQIKTKPNNKQPIETVIFNREHLSDLIERVNQIIKTNQQVYWVCPRVESDDQSNLISAEDWFDELKKKISYPMALIHGKMKSEEKNQLIEDFHQQKIKLLVATTVIEVGIDSPNASVMVIENANHMGLSTLHQLRGRVGRGSMRGYCVLVYDGYLSSNQKQRLEKLKSTQDGFEIAAFDLETRGAGDLFGLQQKGSKIWQFFKMPEDKSLLNQTKAICQNWVNKDSQSASDYLRSKSREDKVLFHQVK